MLVSLTYVCKCLIKFNLWGRNSSPPFVPLCMQDLFLFISSARILSCDLLWSKKKKKMKGQDNVYCELDPASSDWDWSLAGGDRVNGPLLWWFSPGPTCSTTRERCAATPGVGSGKGSTARALRTAQRLREWDTSLRHPSQQADLKPKLWKYSLNHWKRSSSLSVLWSTDLHCEAALDEGRKSCRP